MSPTAFPFTQENNERAPLVGAVLLALSIFLIGLGYLFILPPFAGFDEEAHYSSVRQFDAIGTMPVLYHSFIAPEAIDYRQHGPMPYNVLIAHTTRPMTLGDSETISYANFFVAPSLMDDFVRRYRATSKRPSYTPETEELNWAAQHPPLYYMLMAPVMKVTDSLPFTTQLFLLRLTSFALAFAGLLIALRATLIYAGASGLPARALVPGFLLFPLIGPMFYGEFARLGNDSLCLFLIGLIWGLALSWLHDGSKKIPVLALGLCFGLGLLTKALFLALLGGFGAFVLMRAWRGRTDRPHARQRLMGLGVIFAIAALIGGWWYALQYMNNGSLIGDINSIALASEGGIFANLPARSLLGDFLNASIRLFLTWSWTSRSLSIEPIVHIPLLILEIWVFVSYMRALRHHAAASIAWLPVWLTAPFLAGLGWQILVAIDLEHAVLKPVSVGGWYLYVLTPVLALAASHGMARIAKTSKKRLMLQGLLLYAVAFLAISLWTEASLFGGCATENVRRFYHFPDASFCLDRWQEIAANLAVLGWPSSAAVAFSAGFFCLLLGLFLTRKLWTPETISLNGPSDYNLA